MSGKAAFKLSRVPTSTLYSLPESLLGSQGSVCSTQSPSDKNTVPREWETCRNKRQILLGQNKPKELSCKYLLTEKKVLCSHPEVPFSVILVERSSPKATGYWMLLKWRPRFTPVQAKRIVFHVSLLNSVDISKTVAMSVAFCSN